MTSAHQHEAGDGQVRLGLPFSDADRSRPAGSNTRTDLGLHTYLSKKTTGADEAKAGPSTSSTQDGTSAKGPKDSPSFKALPKAPSGRPYTSWQLPSGKKLVMLGALLPDHYQLNADMQLPWICPVRSCRALYSTPQGVDIHFCRSHEAETFNDNLDGTLSLVGRRTGVGKLPAAVVSQRRQPLESGGASMREPSLPAPYLPSRTNTQGSQAAPSASSSPPEPQKPAQSAVLPPPDTRRSDRRSPTLDLESQGARSLWKHIKPHLDRLPLSIRHDSTGGLLGKLLEMPKLRDLQMEPEATDTFKATTHYSCGIDASLTHGQRNPDTATSAQEPAPQTSSEPPIVEEGAIDTRHEPHTPILPKRTPAPGGPDGQAEPEVECFSEIAVACFASQLKNNKQDKAALLPAASVTTDESSKSANSNASAQPSQSHTNEAVPYLLTSVPEAEAVTPPPTTPSRGSIRLVRKSSTRASNPTPAPKTPEGRKQLSIHIPETPPSRSAQQHHDRVREQDPDLSPVSATRRSERLRTKTPATPSNPGGLHSPTQKQSSTNKRKLDDVESGSSGAGTNSVRFKRREVHLSSFSQASSSGSSALSSLAPPTPVSAVSPQHRCRDSLELEDWEIGPGRVRSGKQNIAFSTTYLRTAKPVHIHPGIGFQVITLHPGTSFRLEAQAGRIRIVSIASGKTRVRISDADEMEFSVGAGGAVKVPPDTTCVLQNRLAMDATLHVCCLKQHQQA
ncbi:hypothetical protein DL771_011770 [Monosporascus sp. 5C6A]|nr:hypothetical protein DL771_011770 [Monosporascus sp. 5C6A]